MLVALVPALVILVYDEWLARERGFAALTDLSTRVVRLLQREMDDRITRGAQRLAVLAADPDVVALSPAATRKLVDALREDRLYNNLLIADGTTGDVRASAVPLDRKANVRELLAFERARRTLDFATGAFLPEPATGEPGLNLAQPVVNEVGTLTSVVCASIDLDWVSGFIERSGLPASTVLTVLDGQGIVQYRSVDLEKYVGKHAGEWATALDTAQSVRGLAGLDGVERLYVAEPLEFRGQHTGTRVTLGIALAPYRAALNAALRRNLGLLLAATLVCFLIAWLVGEALFLREVRPIIATARKVSAGDLEARTGFGHERGELRELGRAIDDAVAAQQTSHRDLVAAREQAVEANRAKGSFLAMMSHEIRTPMNAIINMNALALEIDLPAEGASVRQRRAFVRTQPARHPQRHPRLLEDRSRQAAARRGAVQRPGRARGSHRDLPRDGHPEARRARHARSPDGPRPARRRRAAFPPGAHESRRQRLQVHARRRGRAESGTRVHRERRAKAT